MNLPLAPETLRMAADALLLAGLLGSWFAWIRTNRRQRRLEALLAEAASELDAATRQLRDTARLLDCPATGDSGSTSTDGNVDRQAEPACDPARRTIARQTYRHHASSAAPPRRTSDAEGHTSPAARTERILRMLREGQSTESIAHTLNMPLAQVRLIRKLHAANPGA
ncbi:MAG: hypothetical protein R8K47_06270 [Mariprofundaceae bacterium]